MEQRRPSIARLVIAIQACMGLVSSVLGLVILVNIPRDASPYQSLATVSVIPIATGLIYFLVAVGLSQDIRDKRGANPFWAIALTVSILSIVVGMFNLIAERPTPYLLGALILIPNTIDLAGLLSPQVKAYYRKKKEPLQEAPSTYHLH